MGDLGGFVKLAHGNDPAGSLRLIGGTGSSDPERSRQAHPTFSPVPAAVNGRFDTAIPLAFC